MRTFEILDRSGVVVAEHELEDSMAPALLDGFTARIIAVDGLMVRPDAVPEIGPYVYEVRPVPERLPTVEDDEAAPAPEVEDHKSASQE